MAELRKYGVSTTLNFPLFAAGTNDFKTDAAHASGDTIISKDEGAEANTTNGFVDEGRSYSLTLTATEMEAARIVITIIDQGTKAYDDQCIIIETYGHASAQHPFDLGTASTAQTGDAYARLGAPVGASVSADVAAIKTQTAAIETDTGTDIPSTLSAIAGYIDTEIAAIKAKTDNLPASPAATGDIPSAATIAGAVWDEAYAGHLTSGTFGNVVANLPDAATVAYEVWQANPAGWSGVDDTFGNLLIGAGYATALIKPVTDKLDSTLELDSTVYRFTTNALEQAPTGGGGGLDAAGVRAAIGLASANLDTQLGAIDTVVDAILVDTAEIGAAGAGLTALASAANLSTLASYVDTEVAAIKAKTDNLPSDPADHSVIIAATDAILTAVNTVPTASANATAVRSELATELGRIDAAVTTRMATFTYTAPLDAAGTRSALGMASANLDTQLSAIDTVVDAVKLKTDGLTYTVAGLVDVNIQSVNDAAITGNGQSGTEWGPA